MIGNAKICGGRAFIIAEAGSNFNGDLGTAKRLIEEAAAAGADAVKFQTFRAEKVITADVLKPSYQKGGARDTESYQQSLRKFEISEEQHMELKAFCGGKGIVFLSTPHGQEESVELLERVGVPAYKIASGDITNIPFLKFVAKTRKPLFLSTGMAAIAEIKDAISAIRKAGNNLVVAMQCTSSYPCRIEDANLLAMPAIGRQCGVPVGFSDHTTSVALPAAAVALGAAVIEKHFTLDRNMEGPDHKASLEPREFALMVRYVREAEEALGSPAKKPLACERELLKIIRKSVVAAVGIKAGEKISAKMLEIKRPGTGIPPEEIRKVVGRTAKRDIPKDSLVSFKDLK